MLLAAATEADKLNLDISLAMWAILGAVIVVMLAFDLVVYARGHIPSVRENTLWSIGWIVVALAFGAVFWAWQGGDAGSQYLAGYLLERSLSLDNIFVFAVILAYFAVPGEKVQGKVLAWGIMLALVLRLIFILLGAALLDAFHVTFYVFGALLLYTAWKLARHDDAEIEPEHNPLLKQLRKRVTMTDDYDGDKLFTKDERQARRDAAARRLRRRSRRPTSSSPSTRSRRSSPSPRSRSSSSRPTRSR